MKIGKKFAITSLVLSIAWLLLVLPGLAVWLHTISVSSSDHKDLFVALAILSAIPAFIIGILQLCLVTKEQTKYRGLHIANGILTILWIVMPIMAFVTFIVSIVTTVKESNNKEV